MGAPGPQLRRHVVRQGCTRRPRASLGRAVFITKTGKVNGAAVRGEPVLPHAGHMT